MTSRPSPFGPLDRLVKRAGTLAGSWGARARASTTVGQERAILRLFGVAGLDAAGQPLAGAAVERWLRTSRGGLGGGIALPFAMGLIEYDLEPQRLALDVASGAVDLALEAELLHEADRRSLAETEARRLASLAVERIDADRTARRELQGLLGEARRPWLGTTLIEPDLDEARDEVVRLATAGFDLLRVEVPMGRELADRLLDAGMEAPQWQPRDRPRPAVVGESEDNEPAPTGSQRALSRLRAIADRIAAERLGYVRLATSIPPLGVPEGAVVAAFERVDLVEADPIAEIVAGGVDPDRALSDHAFARRIHRRADTLIGIGPGPLVVAPDMAAGVPSLPATRSGRALACQLIGVALSLGDGVPADRIMIGAYPGWLADEPAASARILAEVAIRRALFPDHLLRFDEPALANTAAADGWPFIVSAVLARSGPAAMVMRRASADPGRAAAVARASALVAAEVLTVAPPGALEGAAGIHAAATITAALDTLES
ncbi:MAG: lysine 5,6-aminomutase subunit alpha, partial [Candidatus Limnocylindrales bacterium]